MNQQIDPLFGDILKYVSPRTIQLDNPIDFSRKIKELKDKRDIIENGLSMSKCFDWYGELFDSILDCAEEERELKTIEYFLDKKLKEINEG